MKIQVTLCTAKANKKGVVMLETRYSQWDTIEVNSIEEARAFGKGVVCGLRYKWQSAACALRFEDGHEEYFTE
jgi:hypothetical protein